MGLPATTTELHELAQALVPGSEVVASEPLQGGISAHICVLTLRTPEGEHQKFTLRCPGDWGDEEYASKASREFRKFKFAHEQELLAPEPIACFEDRNFFVLSFIEGAPVLDIAHGEKFVASASAHLAKVHKTSLTPVDLEWLPMVSPIPSDAEWEPKIREILNAHGHSSGSPTTLCHGDPWPGNILWQGEQLVGLIDWEEIHIGFALTDLAIARLDLLFAFGWEIMEEFTAAYFNHNPIESSWLPYWDLRCSQRIGNSHESWASSFAPLGRPDITADTLRQLQADFVDYSIARLSR